MSPSYEEGQRILAKTVIGKTAFRPFRLDVLRRLCEAHDLPVNDTSIRGTPTKDDYIGALLNFKMNREKRTTTSRQADKVPAKSVKIRIYNHARDRDHVEETNLDFRSNGQLDLKGIERELGKTGICCVIDPAVWRRSYQGILEADRVEDLKENDVDGFLRVVVLPHEE